MKTFEFTCPSCDDLIVEYESKIGDTTTCPRCFEQVTVPEKPVEYASLSARVIGTFIDGVVVLILFIGAIYILNIANLNNAFTVLTVIFLCYFYYFTWPIAQYGFTPGYRILGMKVIKTNGMKLSIAQALIRYLLKTVLGIFSLLTYGSKKRQCIHDMLVDSIVIKET